MVIYTEERDSLLKLFPASYAEGRDRHIALDGAWKPGGGPEIFWL
jgi:hypothetical protein